MAQGVGYLIAAVGPTLVGALYDLAHSWSLPLAVLLGLLALQAGAGYLAARDRPVTAVAGPASRRLSNVCQGGGDAACSGRPRGVEGEGGFLAQRRPAARGRGRSGR